MRRALTLVFAVAAIALVATGASAQSQWLEFLRADLKGQKVAVITAILDLTDEQGQKFWPVYREYDLELSRIGDQSLEFLRAYSLAYNSMTDQKADDLARTWFDLQERRLALRKRYFKIFSKQVSPVVAARFMQIEHQIGLVMDLQTAEALPLLEQGVEEVRGLSPR